MKKVVFICLLSFSVCLSKSVDSIAKPTDGPISNVSTTLGNATNVPPPTTKAITEEPPKPIQPHNETALPTPTAVPTTHNETKAVSTTTKPSNSSSKDKKSETTTATPTTKPVTEVVPTKANVTEPANAATTTDKIVVPSPTPSADEHVTVQARRFDSPSFIGGIILTLGMLAVGFMGFKYYKSQTERNYHTL